ncbi:hypothetical protein F3Y22_tig00000764pilonHSYRG00076 [Hibiscus syriacus]|nr:hypothetical protein F3Y22_tig00000764pilonHSYRG00076 [Hibiscus syriacus]
MDPKENSAKQSKSIPPLPRDSRGSLEVFNPSTFSTRPINPVGEPPPLAPSPPPPSQLFHETTEDNDRNHGVAASPKPSEEAGEAAKRAAEWGLVLKTDNETGKPRGVVARNSGGDDPNIKMDTRRNSNTSVRSSDEFSDNEFI